MIYDADIGAALKTVCNVVKYDDEAFVLAQAARIVRRDMFEKQHDSFKGAFNSDCQETFATGSLTELMTIILRGHSSKPTNPYLAQAILTVSQLIEFNSRVRTRGNSTSNYHNSQREPPLAVYLGLLVHSRTRSRKLIDKLNEIGLSVHYDRVLQLSTNMGNSVISQYESDKVVCPSNMRYGVFTTAAIDNIDHDPTSNTAATSFHGTGISLFQHLSQGKTGVKRKVPFIDGNQKGKMKPLPSSYTNIKPAILPDNITICQPACLQGAQQNAMEVPGVLDNDLNLDEVWLEHVKECIEKEKEDEISWSAFHADKIKGTISNPDITALMPLF